MPARMKDRLIISHDASFIGFFQTGNDVEQGRFAATAPSDYDDEFSFGDFEGNIVQCVHGLPFLLEPFRDVLDHELGRRRTLQLFLQRHQGFSIKRTRSGTSRRNPAAFAFATNFSSTSRRISLVRTIRFHACSINSAAIFAFVSSASSAITSFCASAGFFAIQSVSARCASTNFFTVSRFAPRNFTLETKTVVGESVSSTSTLPPASICKRETHGSTLHPLSSFVCWNFASGWAFGVRSTCASPPSGVIFNPPAANQARHETSCVFPS